MFSRNSKAVSRRASAPRRVFLAQAGAAVATVACGASQVSKARAQCLPDPAATERAPVAGALSLGVDAILPFDYPAGHPCLLVRLREAVEYGVGPGGDLVAFSAVCPHRGSRLGPEQYKAEHQALGPCPWHGSAFDLKCGGTQIIGQANRHLPRILLEESEGQVFAVGIEGSPYALVRGAQ